MFVQLRSFLLWNWSTALCKSYFKQNSSNKTICCARTYNKIKECSINWCKSIKNAFCTFYETSTLTLNLINLFTQCVKKEVHDKASMSIFSSNNLCKNTLFFYNSSRKITHAIESWIQKEISYIDLVMNCTQMQSCNIQMRFWNTNNHFRWSKSKPPDW